MDWSGCELLEVIPGKVSGKPLVKGTRIPADAIWENYETGMSAEEVQENYPSATLEVVRGLIVFAESRLLKRAS